MLGQEELDVLQLGVKVYILGPGRGVRHRFGPRLTRAQCGHWRRGRVVVVVMVRGRSVGLGGGVVDVAGGGRPGGWRGGVDGGQVVL